MVQRRAGQSIHRSGGAAGRVKTSIRVLVIDDEITHLHQLREQLSRYSPSDAANIDLTVETDYSCSEIIAQISSANSRKQLEYDVIISDVFMPSAPGKADISIDNGGLSIYKAIASKGWKENPFLMLISNRFEDASQALSALLTEQERASQPWASFTLKPRTMPFSGAKHLLAHPGHWQRLIWDSVSKYKQTEYRRRLLKLPFSQLSLIPEFQNLNVSIQSKVRPGHVLVIVGEKGTGQYQIAQWIVALCTNDQNDAAVDRVPLICSLDRPATIWTDELFGYVDDGTQCYGLLSDVAKGPVFLEHVETEELQSDETPSTEIDERLRRLLSSERRYKLTGGDQSLPFRGIIVLLWEGSRTGAEHWLRRYSAYGAEFFELPALRKYSLRSMTVAAEYLLGKVTDSPRKNVADDGMIWLMGRQWEGNLEQLEAVLSTVAYDIGDRSTITANDFKSLTIVGVRDATMSAKAAELTRSIISSLSVAFKNKARSLVKTVHPNLLRHRWLIWLVAVGLVMAAVIPPLAKGWSFLQDSGVIQSKATNAKP